MRLESYQLGGSFAATQLYADVEGPLGDRPLTLAFEKLAFYTSYVRILGTYPASSFRADYEDRRGFRKLLYLHLREGTFLLTRGDAHVG